MVAHEFVGKVDADGYPVVAQVAGAGTGDLAQVCSICEVTANEDGTTTGH